MSTVLIRRWGLLLGLAGLLLFAGGPLHPGDDTGLDFYAATAAMLADPNWVPSHALMLASFVLLLLGLIGLSRSGRLSGRLATVNRVALVGAVVAVVEGILHLAAVVDLAALRAGTSTPILTAHLMLAVVAYPLIGFPLAALAVLGGWSRVLSHPLTGVLGAIGGISHGLAAPIVVLSGDQRFSFLFMGAIFLAIWLIAVGIGNLRGSPRETAGRPRAAAG